MNGQIYTVKILSAEMYCIYHSNVHTFIVITTDIEMIGIHMDSYNFWYADCVQFPM